MPDVPAGFVADEEETPEGFVADETKPVELPSAFPKLSPVELEKYKAGAINPITGERQTLMGALTTSPLSLVPPVRAEEPVTTGVLTGLQPFTGLPPDLMAAAVNEAKGLGEFVTSPLGKITSVGAVSSPIIRRGLALLFGGQLALGAKEKIANASTPQDIIEGLIEGAGAGVVGLGVLPGRKPAPPRFTGPLATGEALPTPRGSPPVRRPPFQLPDAAEQISTKPVEPEAPPAAPTGGALLRTAPEGKAEPVEALKPTTEPSAISQAKPEEHKGQVEGVTAPSTEIVTRPEKGLPESATPADLMADMSEAGRTAFREAKAKPDEFSGIDVTELSLSDRRNLARLGLSFSEDRQRRIIAVYPRILRTEDLRKAVQEKQASTPPAAEVGKGEVAPATVKVQREVKKAATTQGQKQAKEIKAEYVQRVEDEIEKIVSKQGWTVEQNKEYPERWDLTRKDGNHVAVDIQKKDKGFIGTAFGLPGGKRTIKGKTIEEVIYDAKAHGSSEAGSITINIPGDGDVTVLKNGSALVELRDRAARISTNKGGGKPAVVPTGGEPKVADDAVAAAKAYGSPEAAYKSARNQLRQLQAQEPPRIEEEREEWNAQIQGANALIDELYHLTKAGILDAQAEAAKSQVENYKTGAEGFESEISRLEKIKRKTQAHKYRLEDLKERYKQNQDFISHHTRKAEEWEQQSAKEKAALESESTPAAPATGTKATMPPGPGAQTAGTDIPPGAQIEQLSQAFRQITAQKTPLLQKVKEAFNLGQKREISQNLIARTLSALKTSGDYLIDTWRGQMDLDPILKTKGETSAELETRGWRLRQAMKDMRRAVPSRAAREAISKYVDAGGDMEKLRQSAETVPSGRRKPYVRAMQLTPEEKLAAGHIQSFFESRLQEAIDADVLAHGVEDYLHRIYPRDTQWRRGIINAVQNSLLDTRTPGLARKRVFEIDADAERAGYFPVNDFIPRITDYEASLSKVIASRAAVKKFTEIKMPDGRPMLDVSGIGVPVENPEGIREATLIKPSFKPGEAQFDENGKPNKNFRKDYQSRDYPALKRWKWATNDAEGNPIFVQGDVLIHPDAVHRVDALLEPSKVRRYPVARAALNVGSVFKQTMLDFSGFHQAQITIHALEHKVNPFDLVKDVDTNNPNVQGLLKGGMTLGGQHVSGMYEEGLAGRSLSRQIPVLGELMQTYHDWLFQNFIPRVKTTMALHALERNRKRFAKDLASGKMTELALFHQTAKEANAAFGEQNYIMLERSQTAQDMSRLILLAPDFLEARGRFALQAGTRLGGEQRMALLLGAMTLYTTARLMNKALNDEWHFEPENMFSVIHNGKAYSIRTVQGDILHALKEPVRFWLHRLNPSITRPLFELMTQRDEFGRKRSFWQVIGDTISNAVPISMRSSAEQSIWTSLLNAFGGSVRRDNDIGRVYQEAAKWKEKNNIRTQPGEFIYDSTKDIYRPLKLALLDGYPEAAAKEYQKLIASKVVTPGQVLKHFQTYAHAPFSGSRKNERRFYESLTKDQQHAYQGAKQEKERILQGFLKARQLVKEPTPTRDETEPVGFQPE